MKRIIIIMCLIGVLVAPALAEDFVFTKGNLEKWECVEVPENIYDSKRAKWAGEYVIRKDPESGKKYDCAYYPKFLLESDRIIIIEHDKFVYYENRKKKGLWDGRWNRIDVPRLLPENKPPGECEEYEEIWFGRGHDPTEEGAHRILEALGAERWKLVNTRIDGHHDFMPSVRVGMFYLKRSVKCKEATQ